MILLQTNKISKSYGTDTILSNINIEVQSHERVALVGRNGSGKTTLLKIILNELEADDGDVIFAKETSVGYLSQHTAIHSERSIYDELALVFTDLINMETKLRDMEQSMSDSDNMSSDDYQKLLDDYDQLQSAFTERGGYTFDADIKAILNGLNFGDYDWQTPVSHLSGGQKTRLALGKLLLKKPDLLILDEPTNHLDIDTLTWLEGYLQHYAGAILVVSHDRYFLDKLITKVYEIFNTVSFKYVGNYSHFLQERAARYEQQLKAYEKQQKEVAKLEDFIQKNIARASTSKRAKSRRKKLQNMETMDRPDSDHPSAKFSFDIKKQSGHDVLFVRDLSFGYDTSASLADDVSFAITRGESVALVGPNGIGKTTLLKTLAGDLPRLNGQIDIGSNVSIGFYDQEQEDLNPNKTVLDELWDQYPNVKEMDIRTVLGNFLFSGEDVLKKVHALSGGEKARLLLAKLMMRKDNVLIFDEPTNHLDLDSKEVLESALLEYPGTLLFVSHDRYFMNKIADRILELSTSGLKDYIGDYDYYVDKKAEEQELAVLKANKNPSMTQVDQRQDHGEGKTHYENQKAQRRDIRKLERSIEDTEQKIEQLEGDIETLEHQLADPEVFNDYQKAADIHSQLEHTKHQLDEAMQLWETHQHKLENLTGE
ncbi:ABC-F family ATP-binding cassette domain-containing protein [Tuberibacillus sp. Marseille-P3662]|uniref:ABC-F family ATP-binding cassette domain-containing protein n=1 Tax=Tuberibacillus sp. Marseille-P3662 TaxID=1965358 RepID=UPI000A1C83BC|nr:ABC-F family ATP-binding cassette domain-containing protein [Tuberibacillus sp. Marseille-P3662]